MKVVVPEARINLAQGETKESFPCFPNYSLEAVLWGQRRAAFPIVSWDHELKSINWAAPEFLCSTLGLMFCDSTSLILSSRQCTADPVRLYFFTGALTAVHSWFTCLHNCMTEDFNPAVAPCPLRYERRKKGKTDVTWSWQLCRNYFLWVRS